jgi:hypothetical protein
MRFWACGSLIVLPLAASECLPGIVEAAKAHRKRLRDAANVESRDGRVIRRLEFEQNISLSGKKSANLRLTMWRSFGHIVNYFSKADKHTWLVFMQLGADCSRGCAARSIAHPIFATHPCPLTICESTPAMPVAIRSNGVTSAYSLPRSPDQIMRCKAMA